MSDADEPRAGAAGSPRMRLASAAASSASVQCACAVHRFSRSIAIGSRPTTRAGFTQATRGSCGAPTLASAAYTSRRAVVRMRGPSRSRVTLIVALLQLTPRSGLPLPPPPPLAAAGSSSPPGYSPPP